MGSASTLQPTFFDKFQCIGAACEDTCCDGWQVPVDKNTYERYGSCSTQTWSKPLQQFFTINPFRTGDHNHAVIDLAGSRCPLLTDGLCSIQAKLGESYLSKTCATYPRVRHTVGNVIEQSLDLSCPEAARITLLDPAPIAFTKAVSDQSGPSTLDINYVKHAADPVQAFREIRNILIAVLQNRTRSIASRLITLGHLCEQLEQELSERNDISSIIEALRTERGHLSAPAEDPSSNPRFTPADQLALLIEMTICRINADFTHPRFLECNAEFAQGLGWTMESTMDDLSERFTASYYRYYLLFISRHGHMIEHYLVTYLYKSLFPFGSQALNRQFLLDGFHNTIANHYRFMMANYAIMNTILIGMAALHKEALSPDHVIKLMQSSAKTFEHSMTYPGRIIKLLNSKGLTNPCDMAAILQNQGQARVMTAAVA